MAGMDLPPAVWRCRAIIFCLMGLCLSGCTKTGARALREDRLAYGDAISDSWKQQMLLNVIRLRYGDTPIFLDPNSVIAQAGTVNQAQLTISGSTPIPSNPLSIVGGSLLNQHLVQSNGTVTYTPLIGDRFTKSMLTPLPPRVILELAQAGYPIEAVFRVMLFSINGLSNQRSAGALKREPDPGFIKVVKHLGELQQQGLLAMRLEKREKGELVLLTILDPQTTPEALEVRKLLGMNADATELTVVYGGKAASKNELALLTKSLTDVLFELAAGAEVPEKDIEEGRVLPAIKLSPELEKIWGPLVRIHSSGTPPADAFTAVRYRNLWFYIDDTDIQSKRLFSFIMFLISLAETGSPASAPVITVPSR